MKFGVKTYDSEDFLNYFFGEADFFEVQAIRGRDYSFLKKFAGKVQIVIHAEHYSLGVNAADSSLISENLNSIKFAIEVANIAKAKKIILHPGNISNKNCSKENAINFLKSVSDKRIILENLPRTKDYFSLGSTPEEIKELIKETGFGFCFDINHAIQSAIFYQEDIKAFLVNFEKLKPKHYHLGGQTLNPDKTHLSLSESDFDLLTYLQILNKNAEITLETKIDEEDVESDLKFVRNL
jgi:uncharacterized protein (UPF0276 family)